MKMSLGAEVPADAEQAADGYIEHAWLAAHASTKS